MDILPELSLGRRHLPWALVRVRESVAVRPEGGDRVRGSACARGVAASTSRGAGTNATARIPNVSGRSVSGRRHGDRPSIATATRPKPDMLRPRKRAASEPSPRHRPWKAPKLRRRVVTQQKLFFPPLCARPGCHEHPVTSFRNPARYCCPACRQAVRNVQDRERKWLVRGTLDGRNKRAIEYQTARQRRMLRQCHVAEAASSRSPPQ